MKEKIICPVCGEKAGQFMSDIPMIKEKGMCFSCDLWSKRAKELPTLPKYQTAIIDNTWYTIGNENSQSSFRGFGGARFQIEFNDGHRVVSTNLWCGGDIPEYWKNKIQNNAKFEKNLKWKQIGKCSYLVEEK